MTPVVQLTEVSEFMKRHLVDIFDTMLAMPAVLAQADGQPAHEEHVTGSVSFVGQSVTGTVYLHLSTAFADRMAAAMLGLPPEELIQENDANDVVGEITNMLTGGLKSWLCDAGAECVVSPPTIIRGHSFAIEQLPGIQREWLTFACGTDQAAVEIHLKLNS